MFPPRDATEREKRIALYDGEIRYTDEHIARLLELLAEHGIDATNSLVILTADHGEEFRDPHPGDPGGWFHARTLYEELIHVPLVISFPDKRFAGRIVDEPVGLVDLVPTIIDFVGIDTAGFAAQLQGKSLLPLLRGEELPKPVVLSGGNHGRLALLSEGWKYYRYHAPTKLNVTPALDRPKAAGTDIQEGAFEEELYDLRSDPEETIELSAARPDMIAAFRRQASAQPGRRWDRPVHSAAIDAETAAELRALGYLD
jgi:arylsulfatase A-like enzyme